MLDGVVSWLSVHAAAFLASGHAPEAGAEALTGGLACYGVYRAGDGRHLTVGALEPKFWRSLCHALGHPELVRDQFGPPERQREMARALQETFGRRGRDEWLEILGEVPGCVGPVNDLAEALADPQVRHRRMVAEVDGVEVGPAPALKLFDEGAPTPLVGAPALGEHTQEILADLGVGPEELGALRTRGVV
jgi:crotonobetainyl-CoA:carnitine CoA-transferase CaiB-like acyl-CoA transferase